MTSSVTGLLTVVVVVFAVYIDNVEAINIVVKCYPNATITFSNPIPDALFYGMAIDSDAKCNMTFSDDNALITLTGCSKSDNIVIQLTEVQHTNGVLGGAGKVMVNIMCAEIDPGIERNIVQRLGANMVSSDDATVVKSFPKFSYIRDNVTSPPLPKATLMETVYFTYDLYEGYVMRFLQCTAYAGRDTISIDDNHKLIEDDCTADAELIQSFSPSKTMVVGNYTRYYTDMTMFRFWSSMYLTIECDVKICLANSNSSCIMNTCDNTKRRRSVDQIEDSNVQYRKSVATFLVEDNPNYNFYPYDSASSIILPGTLASWLCVLIGLLSK